MQLKLLKEEINGENLLVKIFKKSIRIIKKFGNKVSQVIEEMPEEEFEEIKDEVKNDFNKIASSTDFDETVANTLIRTVAGRKMTYEPMELSSMNVDWDDMNKRKAINVVEKYNRNISESLFNFQELKQTARKAMVKAVIIVWWVEKLLKK